jgi:hypothetical protein
MILGCRSVALVAVLQVFFESSGGTVPEGVVVWELISGP